MTGSIPTIPTHPRRRSGSSPPTPSPLTSAVNPTTSNRPTARFDPYEAFWSQDAGKPRRRICLAPADLSPDLNPGGIFGGIIGRMIAEQTKANDPLERLAKSSILGDIPKLLAASNPTNPGLCPE